MMSCLNVVTIRYSVRTVQPMIVRLGEEALNISKLLSCQGIVALIRILRRWVTVDKNDDLVVLVSRAVRILEQSMSSLAPYSPTPLELLDTVAAVAAQYLPREVRQPSVLEAGCGDGRVAKAIADKTGSYTICLELDEKLVIEASKKVNHLIDVVQADLRRIPLRLVDLAYAYLLPDGVTAILKQGVAKVLLSLDYYDPERPPKHHLLVNRHYLYIYG